MTDGTRTVLTSGTNSDSSTPYVQYYSFKINGSFFIPSVHQKFSFAEQMVPGVRVCVGLTQRFLCRLLVRTRSGKRIKNDRSLGFRTRWLELEFPVGVTLVVPTDGQVVSMDS